MDKSKREAHTETLCCAENKIGNGLSTFMVRQKKDENTKK